MTRIWSPKTATKWLDIETWPASLCERGEIPREPLT